VVEVMGRHAGHLALWSGVAGQAHMILIPEHPFSYQRVFQQLSARIGEPELTRRLSRPRYSVIVVAEGASAEGGGMVTVDDRLDAFGHVRLGGVGEVLAKRIATETPYESRAVVLGHPQRGGAPSPIDRIMGMMFGACAAEAVADGRFGTMVSARGVAPACELSLVDLSQVQGKINVVDVDRYYDTERYHLKGIGM
jgi:6-phosphofructokinase 1